LVALGLVCPASDPIFAQNYTKIHDVFFATMQKHSNFLQKQFLNGSRWTPLRFSFATSTRGHQTPTQSSQWHGSKLSGSEATFADTPLASGVLEQTRSPENLGSVGNKPEIILAA
jgi:hypothetical protein